jgi:hypothetical protein
MESLLLLDVYRAVLINLESDVTILDLNLDRRVDLL